MLPSGAGGAPRRGGPRRDRRRRVARHPRRPLPHRPPPPLARRAQRAPRRGALGAGVRRALWCACCCLLPIQRCLLPAGCCLLGAACWALGAAAGRCCRAACSALLPARRRPAPTPSAHPPPARPQGPRASARSWRGAQRLCCASRPPTTGGTGAPWSWPRTCCATATATCPRCAALAAAAQRSAAQRSAAQEALRLAQGCAAQRCCLPVGLRRAAAAAVDCRLLACHGQPCCQPCCLPPHTHTTLPCRTGRRTRSWACGSSASASPAPPASSGAPPPRAAAGRHAAAPVLLLLWSAAAAAAEEEPLLLPSLARAAWGSRWAVLVACG